MKTQEIIVTKQGIGMNEALDESEKAGIQIGLSDKELLRLRLLSEELFCMVRSIAGDVDAAYWLEYEGKSFSIHLKSEVKLTKEMYDELVEVSTKGKNSAVRGFMENIKNMIFVFMLPRKMDYYNKLSDMISLGSYGSDFANSTAYNWSMSRYRMGLNNSGDYDNDDIANARDDLEVSIVANLSDEITVSIVENCVEIIIFKAF